MAYDRRTSIHGRRLALNSTGAIVDFNGYGAVMKNSTGAIQTSSTLLTFAGDINIINFQSTGRWISAYELVSSSEATLSAFGLSAFSSATATARNFTMPAPAGAGVFKEVMSLSSATSIILETTAAATVFVTTGASSTRVTFALAAGAFGDRLLLRGGSTVRWFILSKTAGVS